MIENLAQSPDMAEPQFKKELTKLLKICSSRPLYFANVAESTTPKFI